MSSSEHAPRWRKSSYSGSTGSDCVEAAALPGGMIGVRDSKNPAGGHLVFTPAAWQEFLGRLKG